jgi:hypothetical protein
VTTTSGFPTSGTLTVITDAGTVSISYTGVTSTTFTGCTDLNGASGILSPGSAVTLTFGPATQLAFTVAPPATGTAGVALPNIVVLVEDAQGNVVASGPGSNDTIFLDGSSLYWFNYLVGSLCFDGFLLFGCDQTSVTAVAGVATFSYATFNTATIWTIGARDGSEGLAHTSYVNTVISPGPPGQIEFAAQPPSTATAGIAMSSFSVCVADAYGNQIAQGPTSNDWISLSIASGPGEIATGDTAAATAGCAFFNDTVLGTNGIYTLTATDDSTALGTALSTSITVATSPTVTQVTPASGSTAGGTLVTVRAHRGIDCAIV